MTYGFGVSGQALGLWLKKVTSVFSDTKMDVCFLIF
jgi:hypothetical protein